MPFENLPNLETGVNMPPLKDTGEEDPATEVIQRVADQPEAPDEQVSEETSPQEETPQKSEQPESEPTLDPKIQGLIEKYGGDLGEVAKAALHAQQKMTESSQQKSVLERQVEQLQNQINSLQMSMPGQQPQQVPQGLTPEEVTRMNEDFWNNPVQNFQKLMDARDQQVEAQKSQQELYGFLNENQAEIAKHQLRMNEVYSRNPNYFNSQVPSKAVRELLDTAKKEQSFEAAAQFIGQLQQMGYGKNVFANQPQQAAPQNQQLVGSGVPSNVIGQRDLRTQELYKRVMESGGKDPWQLGELLSEMGVADHIKK